MWCILRNNSIRKKMSNLIRCLCPGNTKCSYSLQKFYKSCKVIFYPQFEMMKTIHRYWIYFLQTTTLVRMSPHKLREYIDSESNFCKLFSSHKRMDPLNMLRTIRNQYLYSLQSFRREELLNHKIILKYLIFIFEIFVIFAIF